jgi:ribosomal protein S18 acetylase RimI-like enzyme
VTAVRPARDDDLPTVLGLLAQVPLETGDNAPAGARAPTSLERDAWVQLRAQPGRTLLVAEQDGAVVGVVDVMVVPNLTHDAKPWAILENMAVDREHRRSGIGRAMVDEVVRRAQDAGCYKVQLLSNDQRVPAHALYESAGFTPTSRGYRLYF